MNRRKSKRSSTSFFKQNEMTSIMGKGVKRIASNMISQQTQSLN